MEWTFELSEISLIAQKIIDFAKENQIWRFEGQMGAGKTTLIKEICRQLGVAESVTSPTFSIVNEYQSHSQIIYHFDFYRINKMSEVLDFGCEQYFDSGNYCFLEWATQIEILVPIPHLRIDIQVVSPEKRTIKLTNHE